MPSRDDLQRVVKDFREHLVSGETIVAKMEDVSVGFVRVTATLSTGPSGWYFGDHPEPVPAVLFLTNRRLACGWLGSRRGNQSKASAGGIWWWHSGSLSAVLELPMDDKGGSFAMAIFFTPGWVSLVATSRPGDEQQAQLLSIFASNALLQLKAGGDVDLSGPVGAEVEIKESDF
jgi:hypothetical protein